MADDKKPKIDPELQAIIDSAKDAAAAPAPAAVAPAAVPTEPPSIDQILQGNATIDPLTAFRDRILNKLTLGQLDKVKPWVDETMAPLQQPGSWGEKILGTRPPPSTEAQVRDELTRGGKQNPKSAMAGDVVGDVARALPLMPFTGPVMAPVVMNTAERGIDLARERTTPEEFTAGLATDAALSGTGAGLAKGIGAMVPSGERTLRTMAPPTSGTVRDALQAAANVPKQSALSAFAQGSQGSLPWALGGMTGSALSPLVGPQAAFGIGSAASTIPSILAAGKALVGNASKEGARRAIDLLSTNPTKALSLIGAGPSLGTTALQGAVGTAATELPEFTPWGKENRRRRREEKR